MLHIFEVVLPYIILVPYNKWCLCHSHLRSYVSTMLLPIVGN